MGEKIATLGQIHISRETMFEIELNHPPSNGLPRQIHLQSDDIRMELDEDEFVRIVSAVMLAKEKLKRLKKIP